MEKYKIYKSSNVEWIGEIPDDWSVIKLKYVGKIGSGDTLESSNIESEGIYPVYGGNGIIGFYSNYNYSHSVLSIGRVGEKCGNVHKVSTKSWINDNSLVLDFNSSNFNFDYLFYTIIIRDLNVLRNQNTQPLITGTIVKNEFIPYPNIETQLQIVRFLNEKTEMIDKMISLKLKEEKLLIDSIINYLIVNRLNSSEIISLENYWFQKIPKDWKIVKLKDIFRVKNITKQDDRLVSVTQDNGVVYRDEQKGDVMNPGGDTSSYKLIEENDFVISLRSSEGGFEVSFIKGLVSPVYTVLEPIDKIDTIFYKYLFKSENFIIELNRYIKGIRDGKNINFNDVRDLPIPFNPNQIDSITKTHKQIFEKFQKNKQYINLLKEYRRSLISEVVTGKIKVTN